MIPEHELRKLVEQGYLLMSYSGPYCSCIKEINGQDRYVLLRYEDGHFFIISQ